MLYITPVSSLLGSTDTLIVKSCHVEQRTGNDTSYCVVIVLYVLFFQISLHVGVMHHATPMSACPCECNLSSL